MTMTDPIADMLTRLRNANIAFHDDVAMPSSKLKEAIAKILEQEGYIASYEIAPRVDQPGNLLKIRLKYTTDRKRVITGIKRASKPGLREYRRSGEVPRVLGGMGIAIISTNQGLLTDVEARRRNVGGEVLCKVW